MKYAVHSTEKTKYWKGFVLALSAAVVFAVTYLLILPVFTLDEDTAREQGGISLDAQQTEAAQAEMDGAAEETNAAEEMNSAADADAADTSGAEETADPAGANGSGTEEDGAAAPAPNDGAVTSISAGGRTYDVTVTYGDDAQIPEDAALEVTEITAADGDYEGYLKKTQKALGGPESVAFARFFDISIIDRDGEKVQIQAPVDVSIELTDKKGKEEYGDNTQVVHFADGAKKGDVIDTVDVEGAVVSFPAEGFSAYAIVEGPSPTGLSWTQIKSLAALKADAQTGLYIGTTGGFYLTDETAAGSQDASTTGIIKTKPAQNVPADNAAQYYFEAVDGTNNQFYIYCLKDGQRFYIQNSGNSGDDGKNVYLTSDESQKAAFTVLVDNTGRFRFQNGSRYLNMWNGNNGNHIAAYTNAGDGNNYFYIWRHNDVEGDPYGLDGLSYGLMNWSTGPSGRAMMASSGNAGKLDALALTVMAKTGNDNDKLFVPSDSDISMWTFEWVEGDQYYLTSIVDGSKKYLTITSGGLSLASEPAAGSAIQVIPGQGTHAGEICLKSGNTTLTYSGKIAEGFTKGGKAGTEWLKLVELSELTSDYFLTYSASKVSVSDPAVTNGSRIIVYTRVWNDTTKKYEFYAVDSDGSLVRCYESGDDIQWVGSKLNTMLWNFVEYYWDGTTNPNFYYELYNQYSEQYMAPQVADGQILSDDTIGINLNGRRDGKYYSEILAWDDANYAYVGLKADTQTGKIVSCPKSEADDFYFAIVQDIPVDDTLHTVDTVDSKQHGITMKLADFSSRESMGNFLGSNAGGAVDTTDAGLLSTNLADGAYPTTKAGNSFADWFANAQEVNHLFVQSTYSATGYYEYDSTQNFASLHGDDFVLYKEIGTVDSGSNGHYQHGQFFPYNDLQAGVFSAANPKNLTTAGGKALPNSDPRKNEPLYLVKNQNYYLGMEIEASFTQTPNGEDDWGHDIIYEFTGDDDFWLYVDGELIIDLGGIHNALSGSVNYKTGDVIVNGTHHTLRELFESNYRSRNPGATDAEVDAYLAQYFEPGETVFKDYTTHTMKIYYLERGAGASNLHMRFNLASVKPGTVELSKKLSGVDDTESVLAEFPYQIKYKKKNDDTEYLLTNSIPGDSLHNTDYVFYKKTVNPVTFRESVEIEGVTYDNVFMLKPGETAEINFPTFGEDDEQIESYSIVECGVNTDIYNRVSANGTELTGTNVVDGEGNPVQGRKDYGIGYATTKDRAAVNYDNHVNPKAMRNLTIRKELYDETGEHTAEHELHNEDARFEFRLYLATEFDGSLAENLANMESYHVKDEAGNYCRWDTEQQKFIPLGSGKDNYEELTHAEKEQATFHTSINGSISKIPAFYTVEIRNILAGTQYRVEERPREIPDGYSFQEYSKDDTARESANPNNGAPGIEDTIRAIPENAQPDSVKDPHVDVRNLKGWGLRMNKVWTDHDYMEGRDATYFAVYVTGENDSLELLDGTVRKLDYTKDAAKQTLYWYFDRLPVTGKKLQDFKIREVTISGSFQVKGDGVVTGYGANAVTPIAQEGDLTLEGTQKGEGSSSEFTYKVLYEEGTISSDKNVRVDTVTNDRPGIVISKVRWDGRTPLEGAEFTLQRGDDLIGTFTSGSDGKVTVAFLSDNVDYTLTETKAPQSYHGLEDPMMIRLDRADDGTATVVVRKSANEEYDTSYYILEQASGNNPAHLTIKDRKYDFRVIKKDADTEQPMKGVKISLYKQRTVEGSTNYELLAGYENLVTGADGVVPKLDETLPAGNYELRETQTLNGYEKLPSHIHFTITATGEIKMGISPDGVTLQKSDSQEGDLSYVMTILNSQLKQVSFRKVTIEDPDTPLAGAKFDLYRVENGQRKTPALYTNLTSGNDGMLVYNGSGSGQTVFKLSQGIYHLVETKAPDGYQLKDSPVVVTVSNDNGALTVTYDEGTSLSESDGLTYDEKTKIYTMKISNTSGAALPSSGGPGTGWIYMLGTLLLLGSGTLLIARRRLGMM